MNRTHASTSDLLPHVGRVQTIPGRHMRPYAELLRPNDRDLPLDPHRLASITCRRSDVGSVRLRLCALEIEHQLEPGGLVDRQLRDLVAFRSLLTHVPARQNMSSRLGLEGMELPASPPSLAPATVNCRFITTTPKAAFGATG
jgi:hypothetical protein